ncbi:MAG: glycosyltransferase involved in cell wall biosynthesis [Alteromonadaceae bacterium]|jgi:glycosyltransferase involved in cell wall biosynthesis
MEISVIEVSTKNHVVMILNWLSICELNHWKLNVIVSQECFDVLEVQLPISTALNNILVLNQGFTVNLLKVLKFTRSSSYVVFNTVQWHFIFFIIVALKRESLLCIHNANTWFQSYDSFLKFTTSDSYVSKLQKAKKIITRSLSYIARKLLVKLTNKISVCSTNMQSHLVECYEVTAENIMVVPFSMKMKELKDESKFTNLTTVVFPGSVDFCRKKYNLFIQLAEHNPNVTFYLLGKMAYCNKAKSLINYIKQKNINNVIWFDDYLSQKEFDEVMLKANFLFTDIKVNYRNEQYGVSKDTGVSYLMTEYNLPLLINREFNNFDFLNFATFYFKDFSELSSAFNLLNKNNVDLQRGISKARKVISAERIAQSIKIRLNK